MKIELLGGCSNEELEKKIKQIATAGKLSRFKGNVFEAYDSCEDYEKSLGLIKRIIGMGHKSIIEHDYFVLALSDVTPIAEQVIIGSRLASFTVKSRREVDFSTVGFYTPDFRDTTGQLHNKNEELKEKYNKNMQSLFDTYSKLVNLGIDVEEARFILPYCFHSNMIMGIDARGLEKLALSLTKGNLSKYSELKQSGNILVNIIKKNVPYLADLIDNEQYLNDTLFEEFDKQLPKNTIEILDNVKMINYTPNPDSIIILSYIMYHYQCSMQKAQEILDKLKLSYNKDVEQIIMDKILHSDEQRELEQVSFTFQIPISLSILTHITRHRMHSMLIPEFTPMWDLNNYMTPTSLKNESLNLFNEAVKKNIEIFNEFKNEDISENDLIYFYLGCQMLNILTTINGRSAQWICRMRTCTKAQLEIRNIFKQVAKNIKGVAPLLGKGLGPTCITDKVCHEGRESCGLIDNILKNENI